jgi:predicted nucleotidyltransferase
MDIKSDKRLEELRNIIFALEKQKINLKEVYLFGSFIDNENYNDIDVALISDEFCGIRFFDLKKIIDSVKRYSSDFDLHPFNTLDFYSEDNFFAKQIIQSGKRFDHIAV